MSARIGVQLHPQATTVAELRDAWRRADAMGVDSIWIWDHFFPRLRQTVGLDACPKTYLRLQRTGSRFALDRRRKMEIIEIYHKAGEHAYYGYCKAVGIDPQ